MIPCPDCYNDMETWDEAIYDPLPVHFRMWARCNEPECDLYHVDLLVKVWRGRPFLIPPITNRGVTSPISTRVFGGG